MKVLIVEDDVRHLQRLCHDIAAAQEPEKPTFDALDTEKAFNDWLDAWKESGDPAPDLLILDMMLPYQRPHKGMSAPPADVLRGGHFDAGLRCAQAASTAFQHSTMIAIVTVLNTTSLKRRLPRGVEAFDKHARDRRLLKWISTPPRGRSAGRW